MDLLLVCVSRKIRTVQEKQEAGSTKCIQNAEDFYKTIIVYRRCKICRGPGSSF